MWFQKLSGSHRMQDCGHVELEMAPEKSPDSVSVQRQTVSDIRDQVYWSNLRGDRQLTILVYVEGVRHVLTTRLTRGLAQDSREDRRKNCCFESAPRRMARGEIRKRSISQDAQLILSRGCMLKANSLTSGAGQRPFSLNPDSPSTFGSDNRFEPVVQ